MISIVILIWIIEMIIFINFAATITMINIDQGLLFKALWR